MEQQVAAILGAVDPASFEALVSHLMSSANEQRSHAEALFNLGRDRHPDALALKLAHLLHSSSRDEIRAMSAILLRRVLTRESSSSSSSDTASLSYLWPRLSPVSQSSLKSLLLSAVQREDSKTISKKLCDTVAELASSLLPDDAWPELLPFMFQAITSADFPRLQESSLLIFSQLAQYIGDALLPHLSTLHGVFFSSLSHPSSSDVF